MAGTLAAPNTFATPPANAQRPGADLDLNFTTVQNYVNNREIGKGLLANRPAAAVAGRLYFATDVAGGTVYRDDGTAWDQLAASVTQQAPSNTPSVMASFYIGGL